MPWSRLPELERWLTIGRLPLSVWAAVTDDPSWRRYVFSFTQSGRAPRNAARDLLGCAENKSPVLHRGTGYVMPKVAATLDELR